MLIIGRWNQRIGGSNMNNSQVITWWCEDAVIRRCRLMRSSEGMISVGHCFSGFNIRDTSLIQIQEDVLGCVWWSKELGCRDVWFESRDANVECRQVSRSSFTSRVRQLLTTRENIFRDFEKITLETRRTHLRQQKFHVTSKDRSILQPTGRGMFWFVTLIRRRTLTTCLVSYVTHRTRATLTHIHRIRTHKTFRIRYKDKGFSHDPGSGHMSLTLFCDEWTADLSVLLFSLFESTGEMDQKSSRESVNLCWITMCIIDNNLSCCTG